jgi:hypothetical protein
MAVMTSFYAIRALRGPILSLSSAPLNVDLNCRAEYFYLLVGRGDTARGVANTHSPPGGQAPRIAVACSCCSRCAERSHLELQAKQLPVACK